MREVFLTTQSSFRELFDRFFEPLFRYLSYYTTDRMMIEEVVQDVFVKLWENRDSVKIDFIKAYLFTAARNKLLNCIRDERRDNKLLEQWALQEMENRNTKDCFDMEEFAQKTQKAINMLPEKCREIFILNKKEQLTYKQTAEHLGISVKTVETQMGIALRKIREQLSSLS